MSDVSHSVILHALTSPLKPNGNQDQFLASTREAKIIPSQSKFNYRSHLRTFFPLSALYLSSKT